MKQVKVEESGMVIYVEEFDKRFTMGDKLFLHLPRICLDEKTVVIPVIYQEQLSNGTIYFKTDDVASLSICLDARVLNNRAASIYDRDGDPIEWYSIEEMPFDTSFFKVGHAYMVRKNRGGNLSPMLLHSMDFKTLCFIDSCGEKEIIPCDRYKTMKKSYWFEALMKDDCWTGEF